MQLDLNLLITLDALLEEGSVMGAAERLRLSSSAVSRSLGRLRRLSGDDILVRSGRLMIPTPYALAIQEEVRGLVQQAGNILQPDLELDLAQLHRVFTVQCHDTLATSLAPALVRRVQEHAPGAQLRVLTQDSVDTDDLRLGNVDVEISGNLPRLPEFRSEALGHDNLVVAMRPQHPCAGQTLDLETYGAQRHVLISRRGRLTAPIDAVLAAKGLRHDVSATVGTATAALWLASHIDVLVTTPETASRPLIESFDLVTHPLPIDQPRIQVNCSWHRRYDSDPAHVWLRQQVRAAFAEVFDAADAS